MDLFQVVFLSVVEGLTEFLPISSTFHLIATAKLLGIAESDFVKLFEVFIQAGSILAVALLYAKEIVNDRKLMKVTLAAFIPTAIIGFILYKEIKKVFFESNLLMFSVFVLIGIVFFIIEWLVKKGKLKLHKEVAAITFRDAVIIGLIQALAVVPGVSRAGSVIVGMMFLGYKREDAAKFSFLLSVPTIFAASGYDLLKSRNVLMQGGSGETLSLAVGFVCSFITAYFVVKWFINYLKTHTLTSFGIYRIVVAVVLYFTSFLR